MCGDAYQQATCNCYNLVSTSIINISREEDISTSEYHAGYDDRNTISNSAQLETSQHFSSPLLFVPQ
jgi:hypothetical protein